MKIQASKELKNGRAQKFELDYYFSGWFFVLDMCDLLSLHMDKARIEHLKTCGWSFEFKGHRYSIERDELIRVLTEFVPPQPMYINRQIELDYVFLEMAFVMAKASRCPRAIVGAILLDKDGNKSSDQKIVSDFLVFFD